MNGLGSIRGSLLLINAIVTTRMLWLILSFWYDAYREKNEAALLTKNVELEEVIFAAAHSLATERGLYNDSLGAAYPAHPDLKKKILAQRVESNVRLDVLFDRLSPGSLDPELIANGEMTDRIVLNQLESLRVLKRHLEVYRNYSGTQLSLNKKNRDLATNVTLFDQFTDFIKEINKVRISLQFVPKHNESETIHVQRLISAFWDLGESTNQEISILTGLMSSNVEPDDDVRMKLNLLKYKDLIDWDIVQSQALRKDLSQELVTEIEQLRKNYFKEYLPARTQLLASLSSPTYISISPFRWREVTSELRSGIDNLNENAASSLKLIAELTGAHGSRRLVVDTAIGVVCLIIAFVSFGLTKRVRHMAYHDPLTELPNRHYFEQALSAESDSSVQPTRHTAVLFIDLDRFKLINDTFGHAVGDEVLVAVALKLSGVCGSSSMLARMGGDEFAVLMKGFVHEREPLELADNLLKAIEEDVEVRDFKLKVGGSIGVSISPQDGDTGDILLQNADMAMYQAKADLHNRIHRYNDVIAKNYQHRLQTELDLKVALREGQFSLVYQPQVHVPTGRVHSLEALIRWEHPTRGFVSPAEFIPIAEEIGLLDVIGSWVLEAACSQMSIWIREGHAGVRVAVNISAQQFAKLEFFDFVIELLDRYELEHHYLELEVTESVVMTDIEYVAELLERFRNANIKIAVDDFGTGYSSLQYLQDLPLDTLKIDKAFVDNLASSDPDKSVANSIVQLGNSFGLETVAEGVETADQIKLIEELGVQYIQGYYYSKPLAPADIPDAIERIERDLIDRDLAA